MITIKALNTFTALETLSSLAYGEVKGQTVNHEPVLLTGTLFPVVTIPTTPTANGRLPTRRRV